MSNEAVRALRQAHAAGHNLTIPDVATIGRELARYGLVAVLLWIGAMKFTAYEAEAIAGLVANSPLMSWLYGVASVRTVGALIGLAELTTAGLLALSPRFPRAGMLGGGLAAGQFVTTLTFLVSTPGVFEPSLGGFPALSVMPGQFLVKDIVLLGTALWALGEAYDRSRSST